MRKIMMAMALGVLCGLGTALAAGPGSEKEIRAATDAFVAAWNKHDTAAMAARWAPDGDLINPFGRLAKGRAEVDKLFADEHAGVMKGSTYSVTTFATRVVSPAIVIADWDADVTGMHAPDGSDLPTFKHHVTAVFTKKDGKWWILAARPVSYLTLPAAPAAPAAPAKKK